MNNVWKKIKTLPKNVTPSELWSREESRPISASMCVMPEGTELGFTKTNEKAWTKFEGMLIGVMPSWPNVDVKCEIISEEASATGGTVRIAVSGVVSSATSVVDMSKKFPTDAFIVVDAVSLVDVKWSLIKTGVKIVSIKEVNQAHSAVICSGDGTIRQSDEKLTEEAIGADLAWSKGDSSLLTWWDDVLNSISIVCLRGEEDPIIATLGNSKAIHAALKAAN